MGSRTLLAAATLALVAACILGFTAPGHRLLHTLGFTAACSSDSGCD